MTLDQTMRPSERQPDELRTLSFERNYTRYAEGSVLVTCGETRVLCTASIDERVPPFLVGKGRGWITAEYGMLPRATHERSAREATRGKQGGRTLEIQRLIGRALRAATDLDALGERTITLDCDVLQADGGTRTAAINGGWIALHDALAVLRDRGVAIPHAALRPLAAISVGVYRGTPVLDLDYAEDSAADADMNVVMDGNGRFVEIQGTAEGATFTRAEMDRLLDLASGGIERILAVQAAVLTIQGAPRGEIE